MIRRGKIILAKRTITTDSHMHEQISPGKSLRNGFIFCIFYRKRPDSKRIIQIMEPTEWRTVRSFELFTAFDRHPVVV